MRFFTSSPYATARFSSARVAIAVAALLGSNVAHAACTWINGQSTQTYVFAIPSVSVGRDTAVGTLLYNAPQQTAIPASGNFATCASNGIVNRSVTGGAQVSASPYTFATNVPGIGMRFYDSYGGVRRYWGAGDGETFNGQWAWNGTTLGVEVVTTGPVGNGTVNGALTAQMMLGGTLVDAILSTSPFAVVGATCSVKSSVIYVTMKTVNTSALKAVGASAEPTPLSINLDCASNIRVFVTLTDSVAPGNRSNTLTPTSDSTAQGVALQILNGDTAVNFGADTSVAGNPGQWMVATSTGGPMSIPLVVQYIRVASTVSPGSLSGLVTFTMSYQ
ncbi:fimbrial protein [Caballeronia sp. LZ001]|uniref:fimbrial protein n=1 Tax=Caballeronia sp. LZ001 TaxID=3038553 RepID=UPI0028565511|nr:fimbrial protein [Caballeronia sp. LZ001]MDR5801803.1 fimbrial protein [Caballeronia sp. LZ001]